MIHHDEPEEAMGEDHSRGSITPARDKDNEGLFDEMNLSKETLAESSSRDKEELAQQETKAVLRLRLIVMGVLFLAAVAVSIVVYFITKKAEYDVFINQYEGSAAEVLESFQGIAEQKLGAIASLGVTYTSYARSQNATWPYVTINDFQQRAGSARSLSSALLVEILPFITDETRPAWEKYAVENSAWIQEGKDYQNEIGVGAFAKHDNGIPGGRMRSLEQEFLPVDANSSQVVEYPPLDFSAGISNQMYMFDDKFALVRDPGPGPYFPIWQASPVMYEDDLINYNLNRIMEYSPFLEKCSQLGEVSMGSIVTAPPGEAGAPDPFTNFYAIILSMAANEQTPYVGDPMSNIMFPVFDSYSEDKKVVAILLAVINWATYFEGVLPPNSKGVTIVLEDTCAGPFTYRIDGNSVTFIGAGNLHESGFENLKRESKFDDLIRIKDSSNFGIALNQDICSYTLKVYPSKALYNDYNTKLPLIITFAIAMVFLFTTVMFVIYDRLVERRQRLVMKTATTTSAFVSSLFPENVRSRLLESAERETKNYVSGTSRLKNYLSDRDKVSTTSSNHKTESSISGINCKPIADLFPHTTVLFADIVGFTAWSSTRDPSQVFLLLQTIYQSFDIIAHRFKVFKVETIGDSYVAVTGLPSPQANHSVLMARFALACVQKLTELVNQLEVALGPDTAELGMRFGLHSGPVTAGVLRGERSRFQLFGDTVNTAARMERYVTHIPAMEMVEELAFDMNLMIDLIFFNVDSTGKRNMIQVSNTTASLLTAAGKGHWLKSRDDSVQAKGKGVLDTFWLFPGFDQRGSNQGSLHNKVDEPCEQHTNCTKVCLVEQDIVPLSQVVEMESKEKIMKQSRLVNWITELLAQHMKNIVVRQDVQKLFRRTNTAFRSSSSPKYFPPPDHACLDEVVDFIELPQFNPKAMKREASSNTANISKEVIEQLHNCVSVIASAYRDNPFHNFEHACHVTMSVDKFLARIATLDLHEETNTEQHKSLAYKLHDYTYGITSDPLTLFAIVFSALIHDIDHRGVSNNQLIKEEETMAGLYRNKSMAEQNSLDIAWGILMSDDYFDLRKCLFRDKNDLLRFRQVIVNVVLATDIFDKELNDLRKDRWSRAFAADNRSRTANTKEDRNLRATIVIEHIIQASDVSHTMQHWHIYRKWNERLFAEMYAAFRAGRMASDPSKFWYEGELSFFDNYIIPLSKKLQECNVFGVSSDECLNYASLNRAEWKQRGEEIVAELVQKYSVLKITTPAI